MAIVFARSIHGQVGRLAVATALIASGGQAYAQDAAPPAGQAAAAAPDTGVPEIVVTAQFRSQNLQRTPLAITATSGALIQAKGQTGIAEVAASAPSVTFNTGGTAGGAQATQVNIRGIGQTDFNIAVEPGVGIYVDDVYQGVMYASTPELLNLERVEILRGPQGTLSGRNSVGGSIRLVSKAPSAEEGGYVDASYGRFNAVMLRAGANLVLAEDRLFLRINGLAKQSDGYVKRLDYQCVTGLPPAAVNSPGAQATPADGCKLGTLGGQSVVALRSSLLAKLTDHVEDTITADFTNDRSEPSPAVLVYQGLWRGAGYNLTSTPPVPNPTQNFVTGGRYVSYANFTGLEGSPQQYTETPRSYAKIWGIANHLDVDLAQGLKLTAITAYRHIKTDSVVDFDGSPIDRSMQIWTLDHKQFTQELRLNGEIGKIVDWTVGGFYYHANSLQGGRVNLDGAGAALPFYTPFDFTFSDPVKVRSTAVFAHGVGHLAPGLNLTGGIRYTHESKDYQFGRTMAPGVTPSILSATVLPLNGLIGKFSGNRVDWRVALDYQVLDNVLVYGQIATGFKGGGINPRPFYAEQVRPFSPETVTSYELGFKSQLLDRRLRLNTAIFFNDYKNLQLTLNSCPQFVPAGARQNCSMTANVGDARIKGVEVEAELHPATGFVLDGSASYTDFTYKRVDPLTQVTTGMKPPYTPKWKLSAGAQYTFDLANGGAISPRLDYRYQSRVQTQAINNSLNFINGYGLFNGRLSYTLPGKKIEFAVSVKNIFNKYYYVNLYDQAFQSYAFLSGQPGRPREWSVSGRYTF